MSFAAWMAYESLRLRPDVRLALERTLRADPSAWYVLRRVALQEARLTKEQALNAKKRPKTVGNYRVSAVKEEQIVKAAQAGAKREPLAAEFGISRATLFRILQKRGLTGLE